VKIILNIDQTRIQSRRDYKAGSTSSSSVQYIARSPTLTL